MYPYLDGHAADDGGQRSGRRLLREVIAGPREPYQSQRTDTHSDHDGGNEGPFHRSSSRRRYNVLLMIDFMTRGVEVMSRVRDCLYGTDAVSLYGVIALTLMSQTFISDNARETVKSLDVLADCALVA